MSGSTWSLHASSVSSYLLISSLFFEPSDIIQMAKDLVLETLFPSRLLIL